MEWVVGRDDEGAVARAFFSSVVPRPIGLISTVDGAGRPNVAPFAFSGAVSHAPPVVCVSPGLRAGRYKDTTANVLETGAFVYNLVSRDIVERAVRAGEAVPHGTSEADLVGFTLHPSTDVRAPRVAEARVALECRLWHTVELPDGRTLLLGLVSRIHAADRVVTDGVIDDTRLDAVGRLGGRLFTAVTEPFEIPFPSRI